MFLDKKIYVYWFSQKRIAETIAILANNRQNHMTSNGLEVMPVGTCVN